MNKIYDKIIWHNNTTPALSEDNLNAMSQAIDDIDDRVVELGGDVLETVPELVELSEKLEAMTANPPYIGANGDWYIWDIQTGAYVDSGVDASISVTIQDITMLAPDATPYVTNTGTDTDPIFHLFLPRGQKGETGSTGATGATPNITAYATISGGTGTPYVEVAQGGTATNPTITFGFGNLKGETGATGATGADGQDGQDGADGYSPVVTITSITGGTRVNITDATHPSGQNFDVMNGTGSGDMLSSVYDSTSAVATAGGIVAYIDATITAALTASY